MQGQTQSISFDGREIRLTTGRFAPQAGGSVLVESGDTSVLVTATRSKGREGIDFLPLTCDYEERLYAAGRIPGSFFRREGRPTQDAILTMRLVDRPLRPLFPNGLRNDIQIIITTLSADQENDPDILAIIGASAALAVSDIPFHGPVSGVRIGYIDHQLVVNPTFQQLEKSNLDIVVAGTKDAIVMVEAGASEVSEEIILQALKMAQIVNKEVVELIEEMDHALGKAKFAFGEEKKVPHELEQLVAKHFGNRLDTFMFKPVTKQQEMKGLADLKADIKAKIGEQFPPDLIEEAIDEREKAEVRRSIIERGLRPDGRNTKEIRPISSKVGLLPRTHGSGLFSRGQTQVLTITTLGSMGEKQKLDSIGVEEEKRYMHHYNMPPYSTGEAKRIGGSGRREIGHGALAERALFAVIPTEEEFPYTIRLVSEVLSSNGSTSMASVCGSTLSLMDAGVPIKAPVAGIAMGLIKEGEKYKVLTDIQGIEDHLGDMDFKVAGTAKGVTALQMDIKIKGLTMDILTEALAQAHEARMFILDKMHQTIAQPRTEMSKYAPRMTRITINPEKIGAVIGPGGKMIRSIIDQTGASVDIEDDGTVFIGSPSEEGSRRAIEIIQGLTRDVEVGAIYTGKVTRIMTFGAFVEVLPGKEGLVHVSELSTERVNRVEDVVKVGDEITVMVTELDRMGRINLSKRALSEGLQSSGARVSDAGPPREDRGPRGPGGPPRGGDRPPYRDRGPR